MDMNSIQNQQKLSHQMNDIKNQYDIIKQNVNRQKIDIKLLAQISQWEKDSIAKIQSAAKKVATRVRHLTKESNNRLTSLLHELSNELNAKKKRYNYTEDYIEQLNNMLEGCENEWRELNGMKVVTSDISPLDHIKIEKTPMDAKKPTTFLPQITARSGKRPRGHIRSGIPSLNNSLITPRLKISHHIATASPSQSYSQPGITPGLNPSSHQHTQQLFERLESLPPMDKNGSMNGDCDFETSQMERFLSQTFDFKNIRGEYIVHGVKSFRLGKPLHLMKPNAVIRFPDKTTNSFAMTVQEIHDWQRSYKVYADKNVKGMSKQFLRKALQGLSEYGEEAFCMKFVVRISQCPILMEFDARIISRSVDQQWPHKIKLVSVTGVDFAGRIHDVSDITTYVSNWQDVYEIDTRSGLPVVSNGRDFVRKANGSRGKLNQELLRDDLIRMARLRLRACDREKVQIVVETGIGLGVFAGKDIGIDEEVRALSALAIRTVLEEDGPNYQNILGIVFALPIFDIDQQNDQRQDTYQTFVDEFERNKYQGSVPVLILDQDMHRLTVAIARLGFSVSELNPADSHGVFGEYWQNRGPAVEEKLALTTVGLLVQHHLINPYVLDPNHYHLI